MVLKHASGVDIAFDDGWPEVLVSHDNEEVFGVSQVVEDLSLKQKKVRVDVAFSEGCLHICEEVFETRLQLSWDEGFGCLPIARDVELGIVVRSLFRMGEECF